MMIKGLITNDRMKKWRIQTSDEPGFYEVATPMHEDCEQTYLYRLNLPAGKQFILNPMALTKDENQEFVRLEIMAVAVKGEADVECLAFSERMTKLDAFYITSDMEMKIRAIKNTVLYIGGAIDEGYGKPYFRKLDKDLPIGEIHQIHGSDSGQREVFMTCGPEVEASRLMGGITWSGDGTWTSWPPHQHEQELEETYCYFDMDEPRFGLQLAYINPGEIDNMVVQPVKSGTFCLAPRGYHPTVASPGSRNAYVWIMCAHSHQNRRYDLAKSDPAREAIIHCEHSLEEELSRK